MPGIAEAFICQPAGERTVPQKGDDVMLLLKQRSGPGHTQSHRNRIGRVACHEGIRLALPRSWKPGKAAELAERPHFIFSSCQYFMYVALMPYIKYQPVLFQVVHPVQRHRQLYHPQIRGQVAPRSGDGVQQRLPQVYFVPGQYSSDNAIGVSILAAREAGLWLM